MISLSFVSRSLVLSFTDPALVPSSLAWAETYLIISRIVQSFDFEFKDAEAADFEMVSDQFVIGTKGNAVLNGLVALRKA